MPALRRPSRFIPSLTFVLFVVFLIALWLAGGASRANAFGQVITRGGSWALLVVALLFGERPSFARTWPLWALLSSAILLTILQLLPLPVDVWTSLPGREPLLEASGASGQAQPWRPWSIVPAATLNAASSLIVPLTALVLITSMRKTEHSLLLHAVLICITGAALLGLLQFSGSALNNPLINDTPGVVSGNFANRNHFALFMALGCLMTPPWVFMDGHRPGWRAPVGVGLTLLFFLTILASGSRAGLALSMVAILLGLILSWRAMRRMLARYPKWVFAALIASALAIVVMFAALSIAADRAVSINRMFAADQGQDMRSRGLPVVLDMIRTYFPAGTGLGSFDPLFRMHEPFALLKPTYFNHAHNDLLEIVLDSGLPGLLVLLAAIGWWCWASIRAWRTDTAQHAMLPRLGSAILLLVIGASAFDYPARTPMFMAVVVVAGVWLSTAAAMPHRSPLPQGR